MRPRYHTPAAYLQARRELGEKRAAENARRKERRKARQFLPAASAMLAEQTRSPDA